MITYKHFLNCEKNREWQPTGSSFFAVADGEPVGTLNLHWHGPGGSQVVFLFISSPYQRQGIGRELLKRAAALSHQMGKDSLQLAVPHRNLALRRFCKAMGLRDCVAREGNHHYVAFLPLP